VVLLFPILMVVLLFSVQFGLWYHASHVALTAAQEGARAARQDVDAATRDQRGVDRATAFVKQLGSGVIVSPVVKATNDGDRARVVVEGEVTSVMLFPGLNFSVHAVSEGPIEQFRPDE
jgi:hypothetical protein